MKQLNDPDCSNIFYIKKNGPVVWFIVTAPNFRNVPCSRLNV